MAHLRHCQGDIASTDAAGGTQSSDGATVHPAVTTLRCPQCGAEAEDESTLRDHVKVRITLTSTKASSH